MQAYDLNGQTFEVEADDLLSRAIQHENDHVDGTLFIDRLTPDLREKVDAKVHGFEVEFRKLQAAGEYKTDEEILRGLRDHKPGDPPP